MYQDVAAALAFLRERGEDTSRVSLLGASVGCSVGIDAIVRDPSAYRSMVLMTPGASYLGMDTLASLQQWPDVPALVLTSEEEKLKVGPVSDALERDAPEVTETLVFEGGGIHGTRMFGEVPEVEAKLVGFFERTLLEPALAIPRFAADDPAVETAGFVARTLRVSRQRVVGDATQTFVLMVFAVGDTLTVGAMTKQAFAGVVRVELGEQAFEGEWDTSAKEPVAFTAADDEAPALEGQPGSFRGTSWVNVELPLAEWMPEGDASLRLTFLPQDGEPIALPGGEAPFRAYLAER
jgi:pimeloyl-ACP methyl ester carboxylesterase